MTADSTSLRRVEAALLLNGFDVYRAADPDDARRVFFAEILPNVKHRLVSWGDSLTLRATGVLDALLADPAIEVIRTFDPDAGNAEIIERRRQALLCDLFLTGSNAVTADGKLVNLDMIGNRTAAIQFGPKKVVIFAGANKIVPDIPAAMERIRTIAAPRNARRHAMPTPCAKTGRCHDCSSPKRICNGWLILEKCFPVGRIKVVLIEGEWGL